tara:strand:+ start:8321 stop:10672 length:2352 start_codon:yes stop_codon:yes gene_type:complete
MATIDQLGKALINADAAGDVEAAKTLAAEIKRMRGPKFTPRAATPADIPGAVEQPTPAPDGRGILDYIVGGPEAALSAVTGAAAVPIAAGAGILTGKMGQPNQDVTGRVLRGIQYQPRTQTGQELVAGAAKTAEELKLPPFLPSMGAFNPSPAMNALRNEAQMARGFQPFPERANRLQQERITQSFQNAPQIEAAQAAQRIGVAIPPSVSNPTKGNKIVAALTGSPEARMARSNELQWTEAAKKDMGLTPNTTLNQQGFESAKSNPNIVKPYDTVRKLGLMVADEADIRDIQDLKKQAFIGGKSSADAVATFIDDAIKRVSAGMNGEELLREVQNIRQRANEIYTAQRKGVEAPSPESIAVAKASDALANKLEDIAATNLTGTEARAFQNARTSLAKIYDYERATDVRTGRLDPIKFAKITEGKQTSGTAADIANVAANFPSIAEVKPGAWTQYIPPLARGGTGGALGFGLGSLVGFPAAGGVIGATGGAFANALMAKRMSSPAYQAANAMPPDYRPPVNALRPVEPGSSNLAMFNPQSAVLPPEYTPNFTMPGQGQPQPRPDMQPAGVPPQLPAPGMEGPAQARGYEYARDRAAAEAAAAAAQGGARQPAAGGMLYELDPFTGKLRPVDQGVKGATPETFVNYGSALESAVEKVARGERPTMTAEEMIAWKKTRVDLAAADPGYAKLSDKAITEKMMDRQWIADTIKKAKEKVKAYEEIAARDKDAQARRDAAVERDKLKDMLEMLEERYARPRPTPSPQGPKTRAAKRNALAPENQNQLAP